ncbi:UNVERIFIED_CONTAM: hypothetical protein Scaly_2865300 [Sesamum calycinum]|uniref:Uncharacterized protein n=1 Tax=Sesamum calycinum TaxID=2727403 RepID=A0AAW2LG24_9LAMI
MALLSKQAWRLAVNPQGLAHQVLRAKYFPNSDFLSAQIGSNPSFTWHSIFVAKSTLVQGLRWEVGGDTLINVVGSPWLPRLATFKLISHSLSLPMLTFVSRLLNADRSWNLNLVRNEFGSLDTECILQVSTRSAPNPDRMTWHFGKKETFSVSSAYKFVAERAEEASSSSTGTCSGAAGN